MKTTKEFVVMKNGKINHKLITTRDNAMLFSVFLSYERARHEDDIHQIDKTTRYLQKRFNFTIYDLLGIKKDNENQD